MSWSSQNRNNLTAGPAVIWQHHQRTPELASNHQHQIMQSRKNHVIGKLLKWTRKNLKLAYLLSSTRWLSWSRPKGKYRKICYRLLSIDGSLTLDPLKKLLVKDLDLVNIINSINQADIAVSFAIVSFSSQIQSTNQVAAGLHFMMQLIRRD